MRKRRIDLEKTPDPHKIGARRPSELRVGDAVRYYPVIPPVTGMDPVDTTLRSEPWQLGDGSWMVSITGKSGGVACEHCGAIPVDTKPVHQHGCCVYQKCTSETCMALPEGKTCGHCAHIARCKAIFGHTEADTYCDLFPRRFRESHFHVPEPTDRAVAANELSRARSESDIDAHLHPPDYGTNEAALLRKAATALISKIDDAVTDEFLLPSGDSIESNSLVFIDEIMRELDALRSALR